MKIKINPNLLPVYQLQFKVNKHSIEIIGTYWNRALAYGMRKKLIQENPAKYPLQKLIVKTI